MEPKFIDKAGREIKAGDLIVYGHNLGRCAGLRYGRVVAVTLSKEERYRDRIPKLRIRAVDDDWGCKDVSLLAKDSFLSYGNRVLKVTEDQIPSEVLALLRV